MRTATRMFYFSFISHVRAALLSADLNWAELNANIIF